MSHGSAKTPPARPASLDRRHVLGLAASGLAASALAGLGTAADAQATATPAVDLTGVTLRLADYKGGDSLVLKAAGRDRTPYRIALAEFASGNLIVEAINAGAIDLGSMSETPPVFGAAAGARISVVAVIKDDVNWQVVLVPKGSSIQSVAELKGKRVGYVRATTTHYYLAKMLAKVGLSFSDITPVALTPAEGQSAFVQGSLDAWAIYGYNVPFAINDGARVLITSSGYLSGNSLYAANPATLQDARHTAAIADLFHRLRQAYVWREANLERWAEIRSRAIGVPTAVDYEILTKASRRRDLFPVTDADIASAQNVADVFRDLKVLPRPIDVAPLFDRRFNDGLARALS
ncbi:ABC transporter substrate-binding protein [Phreatobacter stygius]|uniref:Putative aliphatic sulfonates-binding protein n=1 Tax=Phreatobacter stygius TaxID=1940610 RepID=A0A4D7AR95_9HYPH|nr:ABC transporter substrate-binding protein [Phreatobacter stygius]QCI63864.1 ABC transporter substrate-binding protein [Phreatobacter stygius]